MDHSARYLAIDEPIETVSTLAVDIALFRIQRAVYLSPLRLFGQHEVPFEVAVAFSADIQHLYRHASRGDLRV